MNPHPPPCTDCEQARIHTWGIYQAACIGCTARAIARSLTAWNALHPLGDGNRQALKELVDRLMPQTSTDEARRQVVAWWRHDHPSTSGAKAT